jgi:hypothetical protein
MLRECRVVGRRQRVCEEVEQQHLRIAPDAAESSTGGG